MFVRQSRIGDGAREASGEDARAAQMAAGCSPESELRVSPMLLGLAALAGVAFADLVTDWPEGVQR